MAQLVVHLVRSGGCKTAAACRLALVSGLIAPPAVQMKAALILLIINTVTVHTSYFMVYYVLAQFTSNKCKALLDARRLLGFQPTPSPC